MSSRALFLAVFALACDTRSAPPPEESTLAEARVVDPEDPGPGERCPETNPCVTRVWNGSRCVDTRLPNGTLCDDGNECDGTSRCNLGRCVSDGIPLSCDDGNGCTSDWCLAGSGCRHTPTSGNACSDGAECTVADTCEAGACVGHGNTSGVPTVPTISAVTVHSPFGELVQQGDVSYLEGTALDVRFSLPSCAYPIGVELDGVALDTEPHLDCDDVGGSDCQPAYYEVVWAFPRNGTLDTIVRVHLGGPGAYGDLREAVIIAGSAVGTARRSVRFSHVADVVTANHPRQRIPLSISETRLSNGVIQSMYRRYGDTGRYVAADGSALKNPDYGGTILDLQPTGFRFVSRVTLDRTCSPNARIEGRFVLVKTDTGLDIQWTEGPFIPITIDPWCNIATLGLVDVFADIIYDDDVRALVDEQVQSQVDAALGAACDVVCRAQIDRFEYTDDELRVLLKPSFDAVVVEVPYWRRATTAVTFTRGFPVALGTRYVMIGSGSARLSECRPGSTSPACGDQYVVGPDGTFVWERPFTELNSSRIPDPWHNPDGPAAYFAERAAARARLRGAYRDLSLLPNQELGAGELYFRTNTRSRLRGVGSACQYEPGLPNELLTFGVNEPNDATYGSGTRRVGIVFSPVSVTRRCF